MTWRWKAFMALGFIVLGASASGLGVILAFITCFSTLFKSELEINLLAAAAAFGPLAFRAVQAEMATTLGLPDRTQS